MKEYTVIFNDGYYMVIKADEVRTIGEQFAKEHTFYRGGKEVASTDSALAVIDTTDPDGYWFRHL